MARPFFLSFALFWLISLVFIVWALIDIARQDKDAGYKLIWAAIAVFLGLLGVLLYYLVEKSPRKETQPEKEGVKRRLQASERRR